MSSQEIRSFAKQLDQERLALLDKLDACSEEQLANKPKSDDWCARGIAEHLMMSEKFMLLDLPDPATLKPLKQPFKSKMMLPMANMILNANISVAPPPGGAPSNNLSLEEIRSNWDKSQAWLQKFVNHFDSPELEQPLINHPLLGPTPTMKLLQFVQTHFNYHRRQIAKRIGSG